MDGFTVSRANRFLETGSLDNKSMKINGESSSQVGSLGSTSPASGKSFADTLQDAIGNVNELQKTADKGAQDLATGRTDNIAEVMLSSERADIALKLMMQVRNKIIDAYQEVMKMQV
ncbi:MAG: flagellar hook-basal body complex protein FliE [Bdellovibrionaceae bacterium]|nr:flagellar hook-basal body complex protein FliE [Pseudobdellovibrionaceae bacterium]